MVPASLVVRVNSIMIIMILILTPSVPQTRHTMCGNCAILYIHDQYGNTLYNIMTYSSQTLNRRKVDEIIMYISLLHGSLLAAATPVVRFGYDSEYGTGDYMVMVLSQ